MIKCGKCKYSVPDNLKYAIMNNLCPSCGDVLFGDSDMVAIKSISEDIAHQEFSSGMNRVLVNDISLFIFNNYAKVGAAHDEASSVTSGGMDTESPDDSDSILEKIRDEVRDEVMPDENELFEEDGDRKIARLKRLAKESGLTGKKGPSVKRVS